VEHEGHRHGSDSSPTRPTANTSPGGTMGKNSRRRNVDDQPAGHDERPDDSRGPERGATPDRATGALRDAS
jgi:hypothetical protein